MGMWKSEQINELAEALAKAQGEFKPLTKNRTVKVRTRDGREYGYSYAELPAVLDAIREPLARNGLALIQTTDPMGQVAELNTVLVHKSGQYLSTCMPLDLNGSSQDVGSRLTYLRRYSITALLCLAADDDSDEATSLQAEVQIAPRASQTPQKAKPQAMPSQQQVISETIDKALAAPTGKLGAPFDLVLKNGPHAGKQLQELSHDEAKAYFTQMQEELKAVSRDPVTLRGPSRDVYYAIQDYVMRGEE